MTITRTGDRHPGAVSLRLMAGKVWRPTGRRVRVEGRATEQSHNSRLAEYALTERFRRECEGVPTDG
jgi:hypothetical protein